jgi:RHS repeat-associated protein
MMPAVTHFDPVVGVDVHMVQPSGPVPPTPIPHPYIGIVFDPFDYLPIIGSTVKINGIHRAIAGTAGKALPKHFPIGGTFVPPLPGDEHENFMGSSTVEMDGDAAAYLALPCLSCQSIGMPPPPRQNPKKKTKVRSLVLPTSIVLPIPKGAPVLIGGSPTISLFSLAFHLVGPLAKAIRKAKAFRKAAAALKKARRRAFRNMKPGFLKCKILRAEPVDVVTGEVVVDQQDFELPGRIPIQWTRHYSSGSTRRGICGVGWETPADARLEIAADGVVFHDGTGVATYFDALPDAEPVMEPVDGGRLHRLDRHYAVELKGGLTYYFELPAAPAAEMPVAAIVDRCRNSLHFVRDRDGLREVVESAGRRLICSSEQGLLRSITLHHPDFPERRTLVRFTYDGDDNLTAVHDALNHPYTFGWDDRHRLVRHTNRTGLSFYYEYDVESRCVHSWGDGGLYDYRFDYDPIGRFTNLTDSLGHPWTVEYDEQLLITRETDPLGGVTSYAYDEVGRTTAEVDPMGHTTGYEYDERGNLVKLTRPDGKEITTEFDETDKATRITDPQGALWQHEWDPRGLLIGQKTPLGHVSRYEYDDYGQLIAFTDPRGARTELAFDAVGNLAGFRDALGHLSRFTYDALGNVVATLDPLGRNTFHRYDERSRLAGVRLPSGASIRCGYDAEDNLIRYVNEDGAETRLEYVGQGEIATRIEPDGHTVQYHYDTEERLIGITNQRGETFRLKRDPLGRVVEEMDYWGQSRRYDYSLAGHVQRSIDPLGRAILYRTDPLGRIVEKELPDPNGAGRPWLESFAYDASGNLIACANPHIRIERRFDPEDRLIEEKQGDTFTIRNAYDEAGNRIARRTELKQGEAVIVHHIRYGHDALGQAVEVAIDDQAPIKFERDAVGQVISERLSPDLHREFDYSAGGYLIRQRTSNNNAQTLIDIAYNYDAAGNLTERHDSLLGTDRYTYDPVGRVTRHLDPHGQVKRYLNDLAGDRLKTQIAIREAAQAGEPATQGEWSREGEYESAFYRFDCAGNLICRHDQRGALHLRWDANQRLIESRLNDVPTCYRYDPLGRRIEKRTSDRLTKFAWDGDILASDWTEDLAKPGAGNGGMVRGWVHYPETFEPLAMLCGAGGPEAILHYHNDPNGCPTRLTSSTGEVQWAASYTAWGQIARRHVGCVDNPIRLQGQYEDSETGLYYNRQRNYDPRIGGFVSTDPIGVAGGINLYQYAPNATTWIDPLGLSCVKWNAQARRWRDAALGRFVRLPTRAYFDRALSLQGLRRPPASFKESWFDGGYKYEVRAHPANPAHGQTGSVYRVSRQMQGQGTEYMDTHGRWHHQSTLKEFYGDGTPNPNFNSAGAKDTHIPY